jgi:thiol-disulfide isomerase/thioredoxin
MRPSRIVACALTLTMLLAAAARSELSARMPLPRQLNAAVIPPFSARQPDGEQLFQKRHLEKMVAQDPRITRIALVYFATWCAPCAEGAIKLKTFRDALRRNGVMVILVNVGETDVAAVRRWIKAYGDPGLPLIMDVKSQMVGPFGLMDPSGRTLMPKTLVLNRNLRPLFLLGTEGEDFPEILWRPHSN